MAVLPPTTAFDDDGRDPRGALQLLPERERMVLILHALEGLSMKATAERLGLSSERSASGLYARGLTRLRKILDSDV